MGQGPRPLAPPRAGTARVHVPRGIGGGSDTDLGPPRTLGGRPEIHLGSGPDARVERSVTRARRMSRPAKAGATDEVRPAPPTPLWRCVSSTPKAGGFTAAAASADRGMRAGRVPRMPRWLRQPRHGSRPWYCPVTLASGSDPRHESRVALLGVFVRAEPVAVERGRRRRLLAHALGRERGHDGTRCRLEVGGREDDERRPVAIE